jgi:hypothetical protein
MAGNLGDLSFSAHDAQDATRKAVVQAVTNLANIVRDDPMLLEFLRELRPTSYHWIATRAEGEEPITGGHHADFREMREECEYILRGQMEWGSARIEAFDGIRRIDILDACGQVVWSKECG